MLFNKSVEYFRLEGDFMDKKRLVEEMLNRDSIFSEYKEFIFEMGYSYPEFLYNSSDEELLACRNYLVSGHTLVETEQFYLERQNKSSFQAKI